MFKFLFQFKDGTDLICRNIDRLGFDGSNGVSMVDKEEILNRYVPPFNRLRYIYLFSQTARYVVDVTNAQYMTIEKE